jgi:hypothetical protein
LSFRYIVSKISMFLIKQLAFAYVSFNIFDGLVVMISGS